LFFTSSNFNGHTQYLKTAWIQQGHDIYGVLELEQSGFAVSLNAAGDIVAVGAPYADPPKTRLYAWDGSRWDQLGSDLVSDDSPDVTGDDFGSAVSLNAAGDIVAVGASKSDVPGRDFGRVRVFSFDGSAWNQLGAALNGEIAYDNFGFGVSLNAAGDILAVGSKLGQDGNGDQVGSFRVHTFDGSAWNQLGSTKYGELEFDQFGSKVSLNAAGDIVAVAAPYSDANGFNLGSAHVFSFDGSAWNQLGPDLVGDADDSFGFDVSLNAAGDILAVGSWTTGSYSDAGGLHSGQARVFSFDGSAWNQLGADFTGEEAGDHLGYSVSLNAAGGIVAIGVPEEDPDGLTGAGQVRLFSFDGSAWNQLGTYLNGEKGYDDSGSAVSLNAAGDIVAIGAPKHRVVQWYAEQGQVRVYKNPDSTDSPTVTPTSAAATSLPSGQPSGQPSAQPTGPSGQPSAQPTGQPSAQPTGMPTGQPSAQPTGAPSGQPSAQPTAPSGQPSAQPTGVPSGQPSAQPSAQPTGQPTGPSGQPTGQPTGQPSGKPTSHPVGGPTGQPSSVPTGGPTVPPSGQPTGQPSVQPSVQPTSQPTGQPTPSPTATPTAVPTTAAPTVSPTATPTATPTACPTVTPTAVPTVSPTPAPTVVSPLRFCPAFHVYSTSFATANFAVCGDIVLCQMEKLRIGQCFTPSLASGDQFIRLVDASGNQVAANDDSCNSPLSQLTYTRQEAGCGTYALREGCYSHEECTGRMAYEISSLGSAYPTVQPTEQEGTAQPSRTPTVVPTESLLQLWKNKAEAMLQHLDESSPYQAVYAETVVEGVPVTVNALQSWTQFASIVLPLMNIENLPVSVRVLTVDSLDSEDFTVFAVCGADEGEALQSILRGELTDSPVSCGGSSWSVIECSASANSYCVDCGDSGSLSSICGLGSKTHGLVPTYSEQYSAAQNVDSASFARYFVADYRARSAAPVVTSFEAIDIQRTQVTLSVVLDGPGSLICKAYLGQAQASSADVVASGVSGTEVGNTSTILFRNLVPASVYRTVCSTFSEDLVPLTDSQFAGQIEGEFSTLCCQHARVISQLKTMLEFTQASYSVAVSLVNAPAAGSVLTASLGVVGSSESLFFPEDVQFTAGAGTFALFSFLGASAGMKTLELRLSGSAAAQYSTEYLRGDTFELVAVVPPPAAPVLLSAVFNSRGDYVSVEFDVPTNKAFSPYFDCCLIFEFGDSSCHSNCLWMSTSVIRIYPDDGSEIQVGEIVTLRPNLLKPACTDADSSACSSYAFSVEQSVFTAAPTNPVVPTARLLMASVLGECMAQTVLTSSSSGHGGRDWVSRTFVVTSNGQRVNSIEHILNTSSAIAPSVQREEFDSGTGYVVTLTLCNFLGGCASTSKSMSVLDSPIPTVRINGDSSRTVRAGDLFRLHASASTVSCGQAPANAYLSFHWGVYVGTELQTRLTSVSSNPIVFMLLPSALTPGSEYSVSLKVSDSRSGTQASAAVTVIVVPGVIVARITGGGTQSLGRLIGEMGVVLDASSSFDEDDVFAQLNYQWSCSQSAPVFTATCPFSISATSVGTITMTYNVNSTAAAVASVEVVVSDLVSSRSATRSVSVYSTAVNEPVVRILSTPPIAFAANSQLSIVGSVSTAVGTFVQWTCNTASIDLEVVSLTDVSHDITVPDSPRVFAANLVVSANSLPILTDVVFTLSAYLGDQLSSSTTITIPTIGPPLPGIVTVSPEKGFEMNTTFTVSTNLWSTDTADALTYQFGYVSSSGAFVPITAGPSESTQYVGFLPVGTGDNHSVVVRIVGYNGPNSFSLLDMEVVVAPSAMSDDESAAMTIALVRQAGNVDSVTEVISATSAHLNAVSCALVPALHCANLNRLPCGVTAETCGTCLSGFTGVSGDSNNECTYIPVDRRLAEPRRRLEAPPMCLNNCSNQGTCRLLDLNTKSLLTEGTVSVSSTDSLPVCQCNGGVFGRDCSYLASALVARQESRRVLIEALHNNTQIEDVSNQVVTNWIAQLNGLTQKPEELSTTSLGQVSQIISVIMTSLRLTSLSPEAVSAVLASVDRTAFIWYGYSNSFVSGAGTPVDVVHVVDYYRQLDLLGAFITASMVPGQQPVVSSLAQLSVTSRVGSNSRGAGGSGSFLSFNGFESAEITEVVSRDVLYFPNATSHMSSPLHVSVKGYPCSENATAESCQVTLVMQHIRVLPNLYYPDPVMIDTVCAAGVVENHTVVCSPAFSETVTCSGSSGIITSQCPVSGIRLSCLQLSGLDEVAGSCAVSDVSNNSTICQCEVAGASTSAETGFQSTYVVVSENYTERFVSTFVSSTDASTSSASTLEKYQWYIIAGVLVVLLLLLLLCFMCYEKSMLRSLESELRQTDIHLDVEGDMDSKDHMEGDVEAGSKATLAHHPDVDGDNINKDHLEDSDMDKNVVDPDPNTGALEVYHEEDNCTNL